MSKKSLQVIFSFLILVGMFFSLAQPVNAGKPAQADMPELIPQISTDVHHDLSLPLTDLAALETEEPAVTGEQPLFQLPKALKSGDQLEDEDPVLQDSPIINTMPELIANFDGISNIAGVAPPDTNGDIGYDPSTGQKYYVQWVNLHLQAWNVTDPANPVPLFASPIAGNTIWNGFGGRCASDNSGDPIVLYDEIANRWMISQFSVSAAPYYNCIAVSQTSNPAGAYYRYAYIYSNNKMNDYPKYGIWPDGYYMTVNQFTNASSWGGAGVAVYERDQMLVGGTARQIIFDLYSTNANFGGMLPADFEGTPPPAGTPNYFAEVDDSSYGLGTVDEMRIWEFHTNWATNTYSFGLSNQPNQVLPVSNFNLICGSTRDCVAQPGTTSKLDAIGDRLMYRLAYRLMDDGSERMVVNHTVNAGSNIAGVRWYQLEKSGSSWSIAQQGTYAGDTANTTHRWMGSISMDRMGNLALGYSMSASTLVYPSLGIAGRLNTDPVNTLPQGERVAFAGSTSQTGVNRWGDYSSMSIDPQDGCTFWFTSEYSSGSWNWRTRIVSFKYPTCSALPTGTLSGTVTDETSGEPIEGAHIMAGLFGGITDADGNYSITLPEGTYDVTASAFAHLSDTVAGVVITADATTDQDFILGMAPLHEVYGVVSDTTAGGHTYPLYARITIAEYPAGDVYTNPQTGEYSVMLPEGDVDFTVQAMVAGYDTLSQTVTVPNADLEANFGLQVNSAACTAPGYVMIGGISENFDTATTPALPTNWLFTRTGGSNTAAAWKTNAGTVHPSGITPPSGPNLAYFNSYTVNDGNAARLYYNLPVDMNTIGLEQVSFQMYHENGWSTDNDTVQVQVSTDGGTTWTNVGSPIGRVSATPAWTNHTVSLSAYAGNTSLRIGMNAVSAYGNDIHIDDIVIGTPPVCNKIDGATIMGYVTDANTTLPLNGAAVALPGASSQVSATTIDPALGDGFYYGFIPAGTGVTVTGSLLNYTDDAYAIDVADNAAIWQDFVLGAGSLTADPTNFAVTMQANTTDTRTLTLGNDGTAPLTYTINELNAPLAIVEYDPTHDPAFRHLGPKNFNKYSLEDIAYYWTPSRAAYQAFNSDTAGNVLSSFNSGLERAWGIGVDQVTNNLWVSDIEAAGGDDLNHEFTFDGSATNRVIDANAWITGFAADMAYDSKNDTLWQVAVDGDNCVYEMDPQTLAPTGATICPGFGMSERGLAYDPITDTFLTGSWNDRLIKRFDRAGDILEQKDIQIPIAGLAYNPATGHLFVTSHSTASPFDIYVIDVRNGYLNLGGFNAAGLDGGEAGLEFACNGSLWAANQVTGEIIEVASGEDGVCLFADVLWLSESPASGGIDTGSSTPVTLTFDTTGLSIGTYQAQLQLAHNTPYTVANIPVTLIVTAEPISGTVEGTVSGLQACDVTPGSPLEGATIEIRDNANTLVGTVSTDAAGHYQWAGLPAGNDYTLTFIASGYITKVETVSLIESQVITLDVDLRLDAPCVTVDPTALEVTVGLNGTTSENLTLSNDGAGDTSFTITEMTSPVTLMDELIIDGGFEAGPDGGAWDEYSSNFGTPICDTNCGLGGGTGPHSGAYWSWFGGIASGDDGYVAQNVTIPVGNAALTFWAEQPVCGVGAADSYLRVVIDATEVWRTDATDPACNTVGYRQISVDLSAFADGAVHTVKFDSSTSDDSNFFVDDISLDWTNSDIPWVSENPTTGTLAADGGDQLVVVSFDATGLALGDYTAVLHITHEAGEIDVPVTMHVMDNSAPVAVDDAYSVDEDTVLTVGVLEGVLANDSDVDGDPLTAMIVTEPAHGTLLLGTDGSFTYTPDADYFGSDTFTYVANDGTVDSIAATVTITVVDVAENIYLFLPVLMR